MNFINKMFREVDEIITEGLSTFSNNPQVLELLLVIGGRIENVKRNIEANVQIPADIHVVDIQELVPGYSPEKEEFAPKIELPQYEMNSDGERVGIIPFEEYVEVLKKRCEDMIKQDKTGMSLVEVMKPFQDLFNAEIWGVQYEAKDTNNE